MSMLLFLGCGVQGYSVEPPNSGRKVHFQELREEGLRGMRTVLDLGFGVQDSCILGVVRGLDFWAFRAFRLGLLFWKFNSRLT